MLEGGATENSNSIYKLIRIEEVLSEGLRSAILLPLTAGISQEHRMSMEDITNLKKVPPLRGLEIDSRIVNISCKTHTKYWTDIIERNANVSIQSILDKYYC